MEIYPVFMRDLVLLGGYIKLEKDKQEHIRDKSDKYIIPELNDFLAS